MQKMDRLLGSLLQSFEKRQCMSISYVTAQDILIINAPI